jgi:HAD superfamily hydrolase (TIGR01549 family)
VRACLFDVDFTLARPGPELGPEGYVRVGRRHGLDLDPGRYEEARNQAHDAVQRHPELEHDEEIWTLFTERIVIGMGGDPERARDCAFEIEQAWERSENFDLYEDVLPVFEELRSCGLKLGLVSNGARDLDAFVRHHRLDVDAALASRSHGKVKPDPTIFRAALDRLGVNASEAAMVGDHPDDDVGGARAVGIRAFLLDREDRFHEIEDRLPNLYALPAALGLARAG